MVMLLAAMMGMGPPIDAPGKPTPADRWIVELETVKPKETPNQRGGRMHETPIHQILWRQKPGEATKTKLFEQTSPVQMKIIHRGDGLVILFNVIKPQPAMYFPTSNEAVPILWSKHGSWEQQSGVSVEPSHCQLLGDAILTTREIPNGGGLVVAMARLNETKRTVETKTVVHKIDKRFNIGMAGTLHRDAFRMGDLILWTNYGLNDGSDDPKPQSDWGHRKLRVLDVATGNLIDPSAIPVELVKSNRESIRSFLETKAHNNIPEFELWAIDQLATHGDTKDAEVIRKLSKSIKETMIQIKYGHFSTSVPAMTDAYRRAIQTLEQRGQ